MGILYTIIIGLVIGWIWTEFIQKQKSNLVKNLVLGIIGAVVGGFLFGWILPDNIIFEIIGGLLGVAVVLWVFDKFFK